MIEKSIREKVEKTFAPLHFEIVNDSESHRHHHGHQQHMKRHPVVGETHFQLLIVSEKFVGLSRIDRQRLVNDLLRQEFTAGLHALSLRLLAPAEWSTR